MLIFFSKFSYVVACMRDRQLTWLIWYKMADSSDPWTMMPTLTLHLRIDSPSKSLEMNYLSSLACSVKGSAKWCTPAAV